MSVQSTLSSISSTQRDIESLQRQLTSESKKLADKTSRIAQINRSITKSTSSSTLQSKQREIQNLERDIVRIQEKQADLTKKVADKTALLHKYQQQLYAEQGKEREKEQKKLTESLKRKEQEDKAKQDKMLSDIRTLSRISPLQSNAMTPSAPQPTYDAFISHATEDKDELVRALAELLQNDGFSIWYDDFQLRVGDSLRRSIDRGLANSRFGIVILSPHFFAKNWPQYELDGLIAKEMAGGQRILPIWHKVSKDEVIGYSPTLADRVALNTATLTIDELAQKLGEVLKKD
jgi:hypothetical protein